MFVKLSSYTKRHYSINLIGEIDHQYTQHYYKSLFHGLVGFLEMWHQCFNFLCNQLMFHVLYFSFHLFLSRFYLHHHVLCRLNWFLLPWTAVQSVAAYNLLVDVIRLIYINELQSEPWEPGGCSNLTNIFSPTMPCIKKETNKRICSRA